MYELKANFHPTAEPKNGYIGKADIKIANSFQINNISVFKGEEENSYNIHFSEYAEGKSYVVPLNKEAHAAMLDVISKAVEQEGHYAFTRGERSMRLKDYGDKKANITVKGYAVDEPYADGRFSVEIADFCVLRGITTHVVDYEKDGKQQSFVSVNMPRVTDADGKVRLYEGSDGKEHASEEFCALVNQWTDAEGKKNSIDWVYKLAEAVRAERNVVLNNSLDGKIAGAKAQQAETSEVSKEPLGKSVEEPTR